MNEAIHHILPTSGKVIFIGAGPGDPDLLTVKALRWLQRAEIIVADRLVSPEIISGYATPSARVIAVGKQAGQEGSTPQLAINELLLEHAKAGRLVIRLKGGDISLFSNILDELQTLTDNGIGYELVPGVTAALGAAAYAGIPLTARGLSTSVRFLTAYRQDLLNPGHWQELAETQDTLVFYMSAAPVDHLVTRLTEHRIPADRWITVIEQATTPRQRVTAMPIHEYLSKAAGTEYASPSLIIVGRVAALHPSFGWFAPGAVQDHKALGELYFPPLQAQKMILVC